jgi:hypothetical protein
MPHDDRDDYVSLSELLDGPYWDTTFVSVHRAREAEPGSVPLGSSPAERRGRHRLSRRAIVRDGSGPRGRAT